MVLDNEEQRQILIEVVSKSAFPGAAAHKVVELLDALQVAGLSSAANGADRLSMSDPRRQLTNAEIGNV